ncbi:unnamed protein product [Ectocarpus sp. 13 AM-2016]
MTMKRSMEEMNQGPASDVSKTERRRERPSCNWVGWRHKRGWLAEKKMPVIPGVTRTHTAVGYNNCLVTVG